MFKKTISILLAVLIIISVLYIGFTSFANNPESTSDDKIIVRYQVISNLNAGIHINGITAICEAGMSAKYSTNLSITMELQKLSSGSYSTIKTWSDSRTGTSLGIEGTRLINLLNTYRLKTTFTAGNETVITYSYP